MKIEIVQQHLIPGRIEFQRFFALLLEALRRLGGPDLTAAMSASATIDCPSIAAGGTQTLTMSELTLNGVQPGDPVFVGLPSALGDADILASGYVSAANVVKIVLYNPTVGAVDPDSAVYRVVVFRYL